MKRIFLSLTTCVAFGMQLAAAQQIEQPPEIAQFQKVEDQWSDSLMKRDQYALELLMAPTYIDISSTGEVTTRNQQIAALYERSTAEPVSMEQRVVNVRTIEDVAVVDGTYVLKTKTNGVVHEDRGIFTQVYQHTHGNWVCVHSQRTAIIDKADTKTKTAKKSNADLPFHVPFFHKGADSSQSSTQTPAQSQSQTQTPAQAPQ